MPPGVNSRYKYTSAVRDDDGYLYLEDREPFVYRALKDNREHIVKDGDNLHNLAARYFAELGRLPHVSASEFFWVIADFQPTPIIDPTLKLQPGTTLYIPSTNTLRTRILSKASNI